MNGIDQGRSRRRVLHILNDGENELSRRIIAAHRTQHEVRVIDLARNGIAYDSLVDEIFAHDRVISW